jgi:DNA replication protein DnaC
MLSLVLYQMLAKRGIRVSYEPSLRFLRLLQEKNFESHAAFENSLHYYRHLPFLVIDEVTEGFAGKGGTLSEWEKQMLFTLVEVRYQANLCTLMISNRTKEECMARLGEAIMDRMIQRNLVLAFNWRSYRQVEAS